MATQADTLGQSATTGQNWYARSPEEVAAGFGVEPAAGLSAARAAELLAANGPNALPEEKPPPGWRRFLDQYRTYMQNILIAAAVELHMFQRLLDTTSLTGGEWGTVLGLSLIAPAIVGVDKAIQLRRQHVPHMGTTQEQT